MSTTATITDQNTSVALPIKKENVNFAVIATVVDGKITKARHTSSEKDINKLEGKSEDGKTDVPYTGSEQVAFKQTVVKSKVGTMEGFELLVPDAEERINIINKGLDSKFNQKIRTLLIETDEADTGFTFQPVEPTYDATPLYAEQALRTNLSPTDKALKMFAGFDEATKAALLAQFQALSASKSE